MDTPVPAPAAPPPAPPPSPPAPASRASGGAGFAGLGLAVLLVMGIAAVLALAVKEKGWYWLGPLALLLIFGGWFWRTRAHFKGLIRATLERHLAAAESLAQAHCHAGAIEHYEQAAQLAVRLADKPAFDRAAAALQTAREKETAAVERLAFVLYGLHAGRDTALARIQVESVINLTGLNVHDEALEAVPSLRQLRRLHVRGRFITDKSLLYAAHARGLIELYLENTAITDAGLQTFRAEAWTTPDHPDRELAVMFRAAAERDRQEAIEAGAAAEPAAPVTTADDLPPEINDLKFLHIEGAPLTAVGLQAIAGFTALERLSLHKTKLTGADLAALAPLTWLKMLSLDGAQLGDDALEYLARLPALERLDLYGTRITGKTLGQLAVCRHLKRLDLAKAPLDDTAVEALAQLKTLEHLNLLETALSPGALNHLRVQLPNCKIAI